MSVTSDLYATDRPSRAPSDAEWKGTPIAEAKYFIPIGWLLGFGMDDVVEYSSKELDLPHARLYRTEAKLFGKRLSGTMTLLNSQPYFARYFGVLEELSRSAAAKAKPLVELHLEGVVLTH